MTASNLAELVSPKDSGDTEKTREVIQFPLHERKNNRFGLRLAGLFANEFYDASGLDSRSYAEKYIAVTPVVQEEGALYTARVDIPFGQEGQLWQTGGLQKNPLEILRAANDITDSTEKITPVKKHFGYEELPTTSWLYSIFPTK